MLIYFYFYKNVVLVACDIAFQFFNGFSQHMFFISLFISFYNLAWTTLQSILAIMTTTKRLFDNFEVCTPSNYELYSKVFQFRNDMFWSWIFSAIFHGLSITLIVIYSFQEGS